MSNVPHSLDRSAVREPRAFATTDWNLVVQAGIAGTAAGRVALEKLCRTYWYPLYWFARYSGLTQHDAEDLVQAFFSNILERQAISQADAARGRFRTFLLASLKNFHSNLRARTGSLKRGGHCEFLPLGTMDGAELRFLNEPVTTISPEKLFDQKWALSVLENALDRLRREYAAADKKLWFDELKVILWGGRGEVSYTEIARRMGSTEGAVKVAMHRLRLRFKECLRGEIAHTVLDPADIDAELRHLLTAVSL